MLSTPWVSFKEHLYLLNFIGAILTLIQLAMNDIRLEWDLCL